jgi:hypothetical protein
VDVDTRHLARPKCCSDRPLTAVVDGGRVTPELPTTMVCLGAISGAGNRRHSLCDLIVQTRLTAPITSSAWCLSEARVDE